MKDSGSTYLQISDYLNSSDYKPQRTDKFTPQQVFGLLFKMEKRLTRLSKITSPKIISIGFQSREKEDLVTVST